MNKNKISISFIPIAEEYIKSGMLDEAIAVLKEGLQAYPNYIGARVSLGKAYLEKGLVNEAMREFEQVVQVSPDNLFAYRKLVSIYKDLGRIDDAIRACETLLVFSPRDKDMADLLSNLMSEKMEIMSESGPENGKDKEYTGPPVKHEGENIDFTSTWEIETEKKKEEESIGEEFVTETMGDLFVAQGDIEKGAEIYRCILEREPDNESVKKKLEGGRRDIQINRLQDFLERIQKKRG